mmetsp:Transcript_10830/g.15861  ORF Transcript_10830/g.15861 Transcript_10830/m.15861 type:complete len:131 (-) Transcript_10830:544-936(-)
MDTNGQNNNTFTGSPKLRFRSGSVKIEGDGMESILQNLQSTLSNSPPATNGFMGNMMAMPKVSPNIYEQRERQMQKKITTTESEDLLSDSPSLIAMKPEERKMQLANLYLESSPSNPIYLQPRSMNKQQF